MSAHQMEEQPCPMARVKLGDGSSDYVSVEKLEVGTYLHVKLLGGDFQVELEFPGFPDEIVKATVGFINSGDFSDEFVRSLSSSLRRSPAAYNASVYWLRKFADYCDLPAMMEYIEPLGSHVDAKTEYSRRDTHAGWVARVGSKKDRTGGYFGFIKPDRLKSTVFFHFNDCIKYQPQVGDYVLFQPKQWAKRVSVCDGNDGKPFLSMTAFSVEKIAIPGRGAETSTRQLTKGMVGYNLENLAIHSGDANPRLTKDVCREIEEKKRREIANEQARKEQAKTNEM